MARSGEPKIKKDPMAVLWLNTHRNVLSEVARALKVSPQFVSMVLYGRRKSEDLRVERALKEKGAPIKV
jgi:hypothetical protein